MTPLARHLMPHVPLNALKAQQFGSFQEAAMAIIEAVVAIPGIIELPKNERALACAQVCKAIYLKLNPNIPLIPEPFESVLEKFLLDTVLPGLLQVALKQLEKK